MVFRGFECFGCPVKCAKAGRLLEASFHGISTHSCHIRHGSFYFGRPKHIMWQAWPRHFGTVGAILAAWGRPGGPSEQQERHIGVQNNIFVVEDDLGPHAESFLASDGLTVFVSGLFPGHLLH